MDARIINIDPEILGGTPVFYGTRVPIENLFDYLKSGKSIDFFLEDFDGVRRDQVIKVLEMSHKLIEAHEQALRLKSDLKEAFDDVEQMQQGNSPKTSLKDFLGEL